MTDQPPIRRLRENKIYKNKYITVYDDTVRMPDGSDGTYIRVVERDGMPSAAALAVAGDAFALVRCYKYPVGEWQWAVPRGFAQGPDPVATIRAELREELGEEPRELVSLGEITPNSGVLSGRVHLFLARYDRPVSAPLDTDEVVAVRWVTLPELLGEIADGTIVDGFTLSALTAGVARSLITWRC